MNLWLALLIFFLSIGDDLLVVFYMRRVVGGELFWAALLSAIVTGVVSLEVTIYAPDPVYIPFNCAGSAIGTPLAMWLEDRLPRKHSRDKAGRFKPKPSIAKADQTIIEQ